METWDLVKIFCYCKKDVDEINLKVYKDGIFPLLINNGAGKTTISSMLTEMYDSTKRKLL